MAAVLDVTPENAWTALWRRLQQDRVGAVSLGIVVAYLVMILFAGAGFLAGGWSREVGVPYANPAFIGERLNLEGVLRKRAEHKGVAPDLSAVDPLAPKYAEWERRTGELKMSEPERSMTLPWGGDRWGRDVLDKAIKGSQVSIAVGVTAALCATLIGTLLGAFAGFYGRWVNDFLEWLYNVFTSIPPILLIFSLAAVLRSGVFAHLFASGIWMVVIILAATGWTGMYRLVRAEYMKHRSREYVLAAQAIGASSASRMFVHILPNVSHVILVQLSLLVVAFIKVEVILSFLGLGVPVDMVSWGTMLSEAQTELVIGKWWQLAAATAFMAVFLTAFSMLTDSLRDALDPKLR
ncbi:MAG: peptide ABC transporter permease [Gemmatimonadetes bacterium]|nr:MAG: peptide ABC transporter permease [Gemmatimonadota bacterium]